MHTEAYRFVQMVAESLGPRESVVEIGSRNVNGTIRPLFTGVPYIGIDAVPGVGVDVVANGATFALRRPIDTVVCCEVLEHTDEAEAIVANALGILQPLGSLLITCAAPPRALHSAVDGCQLRAGEFYRNVAPHELEHWVSTHGGQVVKLEYAPERGDLYVWARKP